MRGAVTLIDVGVRVAGSVTVALLAMESLTAVREREMVFAAVTDTVPVCPPEPAKAEAITMLPKPSIDKLPVLIEIAPALPDVNVLEEMLPSATIDRYRRWLY